MGSLTIIRTKDQLAISTAGAFTALDEVGSATVSTAAVIPSGVSKIVNVQISAVNDGAEETLPVVLFSGNALPGGDTYALGAGMGASNPETATIPVLIPISTLSLATVSPFLPPASTPLRLVLPSW